MRNLKKIALALLVLSALTWACRKIEVGYLSDYIKYQNPVLYLMPGTNVMTGPLMEDGSTMPLHVEMLEIRNAETGQVAEDLLLERPVVNWKELYDYKTDTTMAQLEEKLEIVDKPAFKINDVSGQMTWNVNTMYAEGTKYEFDLKISNIKGEKEYPNIGKVELLPLESVSFSGETRVQIKEMPGNKTAYSKFEKIQDVLDGTSIAHKITKISDEGAPGVRLILKAVDKNGVPFSPAKGELRGGWPGYNLPDWSDASVDTEYHDDKIIYKFPVLPFPFEGALWYSKGGHMYWHIIDDAIGEIDNDDLNTGYEYDPAKTYWLNFRIRTFINEPGTWEQVITYHNVTHK